MNTSLFVWQSKPHCLDAFLPSCLLALSFSFQSSSHAFGNYVQIWKKRRKEKLEVLLVEATEERLLNWEGVYVAL